MDRAMEGGIDDVGLGVLFGLDKYRYEFAGLLMHAEHLEAASRGGTAYHQRSPYLSDADDIDPSAFSNGNQTMIPLPRSWHVSALPFRTLA